MSAENPKSFFRLLAAKLRKEPDRNFDQRFWSRFENEFGASLQTPFPRKSDRFLGWVQSFRYVLATGAAAGVVAVLYLKGPWRDSQSLEVAELEANGAVVASLAVLENLELFETLDDVELSEQEWNELLKGESVG